jgi:hypothetical protein
MSNITAANAVYTLNIPGILLASSQLVGFAADDIFDTDPVETAEISMGVDGRLSAGFVFVPIPQGISLQADSPSIAVFDLWRNTEVANKTKFFAQGQIKLPAVGKKWALSNGVLRTYPVIPNAGRVLKPQKFYITWEQAFSQSA